MLIQFSFSDRKDCFVCLPQIVINAYKSQLSEHKTNKVSMIKIYNDHKCFYLGFNGLISSTDRVEISCVFARHNGITGN
jgi:hypothetical protein